MKTNKMPLIICLVLLGAMLFTACGNGGENNTERPEFVYVPEYFSLSSEVEYMNYARYFDEALYFTSWGYTLDGEPIASADVKEADWERVQSGNYLYRVGIDGSNLAKLENYQQMAMPEGQEGNTNLNAMTLDNEGNIWVVEEVYMYHIDDSDNWIDDGQQYYVRKLDPTGAEISQLDISFLNDTSVGSDEYRPYFYISYLEVDSAGNLYICDGNTSVYVLDINGGLLFTVEVENWINGMMRLADGRIGVLAYEGSGMSVKPIDAAAKSWGESLAIPQNAYNTYPGSGDYLYYCGDGNNLYGYDAAAGEPVKLLNWIDCDINSNNMSCIYPLPDGRVFCSTSVYDYTTEANKSELIVLTKRPSSEVPEKKILTMAAIWLDYDLRGSIIEFNKTNPDYRIQVTDYSEFNTEEDYEAGLTKLTTEITSGKVPDILCSGGNLPLQQYAAKGLLEDLYPYLDNDSELSRDMILPNVLTALEFDDKLYQATGSFSIQTMIGSGDFLGGDMGWTVEEMIDTLAQHPEASPFMPFFTRDTILQYICMMGLNDFVDWSTGECNFDSTDFIRLLEFVSNMPAEYDYNNYEWTPEDDELTMLAEGRVLLSMFYVYDLEYMQVYNELLNGNMVFKGFPTANRNGHVMQTNTALAMSSKCSDKEGAWQFIRSLFTEEYQSTIRWNIPTNKNAFDAFIEKAMEENMGENEFGEMVAISRGGWGFGNGRTIEVYAATQEDVDNFMELVNATTTTADYDTNLMTIIQEEAAPFFAGQKSAADTASVIQSRISIYVNEQR